MIKLLFIPIILAMLSGIYMAIKLCFVFKRIKFVTKNKYAKDLADILSINSGIMAFIGIIMLGETTKRLLIYPSELALNSVLPVHLLVTGLFVVAQGLFYWLVEKKKLNK